MKKRAMMEDTKQDWSKAAIGDIVYYNGKYLLYTSASKWNASLGSYIGSVYDNKSDRLYIVAGSQSNYTYDAGTSYCNNYSIVGKTSDWYMPSRSDLNMMYNKKSVLDSSFSKVSASLFIESEAYWSSTGADTLNPYYVWFDNGYNGNGRDKGQSLIVRPVAIISY